MNLPELLHEKIDAIVRERDEARLRASEFFISLETVIKQRDVAVKERDAAYRRIDELNARLSNRPGYAPTCPR